MTDHSFPHSIEWQHHLTLYFVKLFLPESSVFFVGLEAVRKHGFANIAIENFLSDYI